MAKAICIDLKTMSAKGALNQAKIAAGEPSNKEIARRIAKLNDDKIQTSPVSRYFQENDDYHPSLDVIPDLCKVLGNRILLDWQEAQLEPAAQTGIKSSESLLMGVASLGVEFGEACGAIHSALADDKITKQEAQEIRSQLIDLQNVAQKLCDGLEYVARNEGRPVEFQKGHLHIAGGKVFNVEIAVPEEQEHA